MFSWNSSTIVVPFLETLDLYSSKHRRNKFNKLIAELGDAISQRSQLLTYETDCIWIRDWFPINMGDHLISFQVATDYMDRKEAQQVQRQHDQIRSSFPLLPNLPIVPSNIVLDGGNVVMDSEHAIISKKVVRDNPGMSEDQLVGQLNDLLFRKIILIEAEENDPTGHADGQCQFLADGILLINDLSGVAPVIWRRNLVSLGELQLSIVPLPYSPTDNIKAGWPSLQGNYVNFTATAYDVLFSTFGDEQAETVIRRRTMDADPLARPCTFTGTKVIDELGGGLHCASWNF